MKKILFLLIGTLISFIAFGQILEPVKWSFETKKLDEKSYELIFKAKIDHGWAIYSQYVKDGGPSPTEFSFKIDENAHQLEGKVVEDETNRETKRDPIFDMEVIKFHDLAIFKQKIIVKDETKPVVGSLRFMSCNDTNCLPPTDVDFRFSFTGEEVVEEQKKELTSEESSRANDQLYGMTPKDIIASNKTCKKEELVAEETEKEEKGLFTIFILGFLGGLVALLTPCVFPMIPLTVSFFTKQSSNGKGGGIRNAVLYGLFIAGVYILLSLPFHLLDSINPDILNDISTNVWLNVIFFVIFMFFAFSFFGYYELTLPNSWMAKTSSAEGIGGILGIFFMALTLALVSFSCTGPILGTLLAGSLSSDGGAWQLTAGMAGFGISLGLPFALFAMFPGWLNKMPKSGGWLNSVKVVLGFLELALAFKFLSNADLVKHWGILKIEVFLGFWIVIFAGLALYLFGKIRFPHDSAIKKLSFSRISFAILVLAFTIYLISGFRYDKQKESFTPLKLLSGLAPPVGYSIIYPKDCPNNLECFDNLKEGIAYAKEVNKPILLDFTGYACVNCRKMEEHVWAEKKVDNLIREKYVLISLHVDDKEILPEVEQINVQRVNGGVRLLENYGHKWAHFQTQYFQSNSQPFYVLLDSDGKRMLAKPKGYTPDVDEYIDFLECGLDSFSKNK